MQFISALDLDPYAAGGEPSLGLPARGMGMDIDKKDTSTATASVAEAFTAVSVIGGYEYDTGGYGVGGFDADSDTVAIILAGTSDSPTNNYTFPYPVPASPTFSTLDTPMYVPVPARIFEIVFPALPVNYSSPLIPVFPTFKILTPTFTTPVTISYVEQVNARKFRFSIASAEEAKVITT